MGNRKSPWPEHIWHWLATLSDESASKPEQKRIGRVLFDPRVERLVAVLPTLPVREEEIIDDPTLLFLHHALDLAAIAERLVEVGHDFRRRELNDFAQVIRRFLRPLALQRGTVAAYLAEGDSYTEGLRRYEQLTQTLTMVSEKAASGADFAGIAKMLAPVRRGQEHTYFVDMLGRYAEEMYGVPLHEEIGVLAAVIYDLEELGPAEVRAIRARRSKVKSKTQKK